jgi:LCP family protein required for cell wall assembly
MSNKHLRRTENHVTATKNAAGKIILLTVVLGIIAVAAGAGLKFYSAFHARSEDINTQLEKTLGTDSPEYRELKQKGRFNMLILGEDNVEGSQRSDTILFAAVDLDDKNIRILSLPRDTRVDVPGHGTRKINSAFAYGGPELLKQTVQQYLNKPILYYLVVDYDNFPKLVDTLGGVDIDVKKRMHYVDHAGKLNINILPGFQHMNGLTALHFVRFRKDALGDIGRVERQQQFIKSLLKKAYDPRILIRFPEIVGQTIQVFKTDIPTTLAVQLAGFIKNEIGRENIYFSTLHGEPKMIGGGSFWIGDVSSATVFLDAPFTALKSGDKNLVKKLNEQYGGYNLGYSSAMDESKKNNNATAKNGTTTDVDVPASLSKPQLLALVRSITTPISVLNGSGTAGAGQSIAQKLQIIGVDVNYTGNAKHFDYMYSNVIYPTKATVPMKDTAVKIGQMLAVPKNLVRANRQAANASLIIGHDYKKIDQILNTMVETSKK